MYGGWGFTYSALLNLLAVSQRSVGIAHFQVCFQNGLKCGKSHKITHKSSKIVCGWGNTSSYSPPIDAFGDIGDMVF